MFCHPFPCGTSCSGCRVPPVSACQYPPFQRTRNSAAVYRPNFLRETGYSITIGSQSTTRHASTAFVPHRGEKIECVDEPWVPQQRPSTALGYSAQRGSGQSGESGRSFSAQDEGTSRLSRSGTALTLMLSMIKPSQILTSERVYVFLL